MKKKAPLKEILVFFSIIFMGFFTLFAYKGISRLHSLEKAIKEKEREIQLLKKKKQVLQQEIKWLQEKPEALEYYIKQRLFMKKKGEKVVVISRSPRRPN